MEAGAEAAFTQPFLASLPGGLWHSGPDPVRSLGLRAVGRADELFLLDSSGLPPGPRATALLDRCLDEDGLTEQLTVGDREALLLQLRLLTLGDALECLLQCDQPTCGHWMEFDLGVRDLLLPAYHEVKPTYQVSFEADGRSCEVSFRLPVASDLDAAAAAAGSGADRAAALLLHSCVAHAALDGRPVSPADLGPEAVAQLAAAMADRDPQAELVLELTCPDCSHPFHILFDAGSFFLQELESQAAQLLLDVHTLAFHYHWAERDILAMHPGRRESYLRLLAAMFEGGSDDGWAGS
jgi:hypothetical protein